MTTLIRTGWRRRLEVRLLRLLLLHGEAAWTRVLSTTRRDLQVPMRALMSKSRLGGKRRILCIAVCRAWNLLLLRLLLWLLLSRLLLLLLIRLQVWIPVDRRLGSCLGLSSESLLLRQVLIVRRRVVEGSGTLRL